MQKHYMQLSTRSFSLKSLVVGIVAAGSVAIAVVIYSQWRLTQDFQSNIRFIRLLQSVQQEVATAHVSFEEALGGNQNVDLEQDVYLRLQSAQNMVDVGLEGGETAFGVLPSPPEADNNLRLLHEGIIQFNELMAARLAAGAGKRAAEAIHHDIQEEAA